MGVEVAFCVGVGQAENCIGVPVLRGDEHLARLRADDFGRAFVAVGNNTVRRRIAALLKVQGYQLVNAISPHAVVSPTAKLGEGIAIMAGAVINADAAIGALSIVNTGACIDHDCRIGVAVHIAPTCGLAGNVTVGEGSFLGVGCRVIPEVCIGSEVVLGAGSVVIRNVPDNFRGAGVPVSPI